MISAQAPENDRVAESDDGSVLLRLPARPAMTEDWFLELCSLNSDLRIERTAEGDVIVMPPAGCSTGARNLSLSAQVFMWAVRDGTGIAFDSSAGFTLPNTAIRGPDVAWIRRDRLSSLSADDKEKFAHICPDFVVELLSPTDRRRVVEAKLAEYMANGARLGWMIDPSRRTVRIYRRGSAPETLEHPASLSGEDVLRGLVVDLALIWDPGV